jgi:hypothetical protein
MPHIPARANGASFDTRRSCAGKQWANLDSETQENSTLATATLSGRSQAIGDRELDQASEAVDIELLHEPAAIRIDSLW